MLKTNIIGKEFFDEVDKIMSEKLSLVEKGELKFSDFKVGISVALAYLIARHNLVLDKDGKINSTAVKIQLKMFEQLTWELVKGANKAAEKDIQNNERASSSQWN